MPLTSVSRRTILSLGLVILGFILTGYVALHSVLLKGFETLEEQTIRDHAVRARDAVDSQLTALNRTTGDWAHWDDTYEFVQGNNPGYVESNPNDPAFVQLEINVIVVWNTAGEIRFVKGLDYATLEAIPLSPELLDRLGAVHRTIQNQVPDSLTHVTGLVTTPHGPLLFAVRPILTSLVQGPSRGSLLMGRFLDAPQLDRLSQTTHLTLSLQSLDELPRPPTPPDPTAAVPETIVVRPLNDVQIAGFVLMRDIDGQPAFWLRVDHTRDIYAQGQASIRSFGLVFLGVAVAIAGAVVLLMRQSLHSQRSSRDNAERYRTLAEAAPDAIFIADRHGRLQYVNRYAGQQLGCSPKAALDKTIADLYPLTSSGGRGPDVNLVFRTNEPWQADFRVGTPDTGRWIDAKLIPIRGEDGRPVHVLGIARDITERKRAEMEMLKFRLGIERSSDAILMTDPDGTIVYVNPAFEQTFGFAKDEALGRNPRILKSGVSTAEDYRQFWATLLAGQVVTDEIINRTKDGRHVHIGRSVSPIVDGDGVRIGFLSIQRDMTEQKRAQDALSKSEQEYRLLFANNPHPMWAYDEETLQFLAVNDAAVDHYGYTRAEFLAMTIKDLRPAEEVARLLEAMTHTLKDVTNAGIWLHRTKAGATIRVEIISHSAVFAGRSARIVLANDVTERLQAEEHVQRQLLQLASLRTIDQAITSSSHLTTTLEVVLSQVMARLGATACDILSIHPATAIFECVAARGFRWPVQLPIQIRINESPAIQAAREQRLIYTPDLSSSKTPARSPLTRGEEFRSYCAVPLVSQGQVRGVLELHYAELHTFDQEGLDFLNTVANQAAIALASTELFDQLHSANTALVLAYEATLEGWVRALDLRDRETEGHTQRVAELTVELARRVGIRDDELVHIRRGALLHDIGKMGIPDRILLKPGPLTDIEWQVMRKHPEYAYELLAPITFLHPARDIPYCHHEKWNGTGYPRGLKGDQIPLAARLFAVVDVWDALRSDRPYRAAWSKSQTLDHIRSLSGEHLEPAALDAFLCLIAAPAR